ncbi:MAG: dihydrodipicolinate synthase family protein [Proteobacteria bacterium]|nr:dihydrodipicolinate synthase family protein [Pseudomonadota bacterium]
MMDRSVSVWEGVVSAIVTPLRDGGNDIDPGAMREYCDFIIQKGVDGIFVLGTTGEGPLLSLSERKAIAETLVTHVNKRVPVIIQTGCIRAQQTIELTKHCRDIDADAAGIVLPYYYNLDNEAIFDHFVRIADTVPGFPLFIYNIPECTGNNLSPDLLERLIDRIETVVGVKTSNCDIFQVQDYIRIAEDKCSVFIGCDALILASLCAGVRGIVSGNASVFPELFVRIYQAFDRGELQKVREYQSSIDKLIEVLAKGGIASFKKALEFRGIRVGGVREPNRNLSDEEAAKLRESLRGLGLIP